MAAIDYIPFSKIETKIGDDTITTKRLSKYKKFMEGVFDAIYAFTGIDGHNLIRGEITSSNLPGMVASVVSQASAKANVAVDKLRNKINSLLSNYDLGTMSQAVRKALNDKATDMQQKLSSAELALSSANARQQEAIDIANAYAIDTDKNRAYDPDNKVGKAKTAADEAKGMFEKIEKEIK